MVVGRCHGGVHGVLGAVGVHRNALGHFGGFPLCVIGVCVSMVILTRDRDVLLRLCIERRGWRRGRRRQCTDVSLQEEVVVVKIHYDHDVNTYNH
ncbi:hypothetical protein STCU_11078 [Strigomonas culicis]|uniref:Uncharacterized protein n=1 Tax=Strigomonas culicis TaxID=28005 RepID=S9UPV3_9TRYP|nr:hypothetical protein STCU_11078 [Strigomonas culicis]|eukprot:EPY16646.1 hypothetical protein STCU_11078 [Strigomonas culicis]